MIERQLSDFRNHSTERRLSGPTDAYYHDFFQFSHTGIIANEEADGPGERQGVSMVLRSSVWRNYCGYVTGGEIVELDQRGELDIADLTRGCVFWYIPIDKL